MVRRHWLAILAGSAGAVLLAVVLWFSFHKPPLEQAAAPAAPASRPAASAPATAPSTRAAAARTGVSMVEIGEYPENLSLDVIKPEGYSLFAPVVSPGARHVALVGVFTERIDGVDSRTGSVSAKSVDRTRLFVDGRRVESLSSLVQKKNGEHAIVFSPDGERLMYAAKGSLNRATVYLDGQRSEEYEAIWPESLRFSPDSRRWAYAVKQRGKWWMIIDGRTGPEADQVGPPVFSEDSSRVAHWQRNGPDWQVVLDGKPGPVHRRVAHLHFSRDGRHFLYLAQLDEAAGGEATYAVYVDGREVGRYKNPTDVRFDNGHFALRYRRPTGTWVVVDGREFGPYGMDWEAPLFSESGEHYVFSALCIVAGMPSFETVRDGQVISSLHCADLTIGDSGKVGLLACTKTVEVPPKKINGVLTNLPDKSYYQVLWDGRPVSRHYELHGRSTDENLLISSDDGNHWAAEVDLDDKRSVVLLDGREGPPLVPDHPVSIMFVGPTLVYTVSTEKDERVYINHVPGPSFAMCDEPVATADGRRLAYGSRRHDDTHCVVVDGALFESTTLAEGLTFSPDGQFVAWRDGRCVVLDGRRGPEFNWVSSPCFEADGTLCYLARKGRTLYRVSQNGPANAAGKS